MKTVQDMNIGELMVRINDTAKSKGWWDGYEEFTEDQKLDKIAGKLLLIHSEVSEAAEEIRNVNKLKGLGFDLTDIYYEGTDGSPTRCFESTHVGDDGDWHAVKHKPEGLTVELADVVIRVLDTAAQMKLPFVRGMAEKIAFNDTRSQRHGGKSF